MQLDAERHRFHCQSMQPQGMHSTRLLKHMKRSLQSRTNAQLQSIINSVAAVYYSKMGAQSRFFHQ